VTLRIFAICQDSVADFHSNQQEGQGPKLRIFATTAQDCVADFCNLSRPDCGFPQFFKNNAHCSAFSFLGF